MQQYLTVDNALIFVLFFLALCWAGDMVFKNWMNFRKINEIKQEPYSKLEQRIEKIESILKNDKNRFEEHEVILTQLRNEFQIQQDQDRLILTAVKALLEHSIHNGNSDEMSKAAKAIDDFLVKK